MIFNINWDLSDPTQPTEFIEVPVSISLNGLLVYELIFYEFC